MQVDHYEKREGWKAALPFFKGKCRKHGPYTNYLQGSGWLECPECQKERVKRAIND
jgi:hypothetical protein